MIFAVFAVFALGCGPAPVVGKLAEVRAGAMPAEGTWTGVYFSPLYGHLHVVQEGGVVRGGWIRPRKDMIGSLKGNADGNLLRFDWEERVDGLVGPNSSKAGKGYLVYSRPAGDNVDDILDGAMGRGEDELGFGDWHAIKQRNVKPNLESVRPSGSLDVGGGDWDKDSTEQGEPEEPSEPAAEPGPAL
ncbi:MAG: hypothetical protein EXR75_05000 [Myxococcales bacterium]|nr:hypothetical protein [Myxococcales bacterium]